MSQDEQLAGKKSSWSELEICGRCKKPNEDHIIGGRIPASRQFATHIIEILDKHVWIVYTFLLATPHQNFKLKL